MLEVEFTPVNDAVKTVATDRGLSVLLSKTRDFFVALLSAQSFVVVTFYYRLFSLVS